MLYVYELLENTREENIEEQEGLELPRKKGKGIAIYNP